MALAAAGPIDAVNSVGIGRLSREIEDEDGCYLVCLA